MWSVFLQAQFRSLGYLPEHLERVPVMELQVNDIKLLDREKSIFNVLFSSKAPR